MAILATMALPALLYNKEGSCANVYPDGKDKCVKSTPMTAQKILVCSEQTVLISWEISAATVHQVLLERDARTKLICVQEVLARMECVSTGCSHRNASVIQDGQVRKLSLFIYMFILVYYKYNKQYRSRTRSLRRSGKNSYFLRKHTIY